LTLLAWFIALLLGCALPAAAQAQDAFVGPPYIAALEPDEMPIAASFFPAGGPLQRYTGRPNAWYAVVQLGMAPGQTYLLLLGSAADTVGLRVAAFDDDPFASPSVRVEIPLHPLGPRVHRSTNSSALIRLPNDALAPGVFLLLEWLPGFGPPLPPPVHVQALTVFAAAPNTPGPRRWPLAGSRAEPLRSPLATESPVLELAVPRQGAGRP